MPPIIVDVPGVGPVQFESEEQAIEFINKNPTASGNSDMADGIQQGQPNPNAYLEEEFRNILDMALGSQPGSKQKARLLKEAQDLSSFIKKDEISATDKKIKEKKDQKDSTVDDVINALLLLKDVEMYPKWGSGIMSVIQQTGDAIGLNPDLDVYEHKTDMLRTPVAKGIMDEVGNLSETDVKSAKNIFPRGIGLFSKESRPKQINNLVQTLKAKTGRNILDEMSDEDLKAIGGDSLLEIKYQSKPRPNSASKVDPSKLSDEELLKLIN